MNAHRILFVAGALLAAACERPLDRPPPVEREIGSQEAARAAFLDDHRYRRRVLEQSLANPDNFYSRERLAAYGLGDGGWDLLPVWNPRAEPLRDVHIERLSRGEPLQLSSDAEPTWDGTVPDDDDGWRALGRAVFFGLPLRADAYLQAAVVDPEFAASVGLAKAPDGSYPGLVVFADIDGRTRVGMTCALCHSTVRDGQVVAGVARRDLDYGAIRLHAPSDDLTAELADRMRRWGPGRADITGDDDEDPVAIPDLWRLLELPALTQAGTLLLSDGDKRAEDLTVLAIRQDTQIIQANRARTRPPRELPWALAMYVANLEPPPRPAPVDDTQALATGRELFDEHCTDCHSGTTRGGKPVAAARVGTDRALADSRARGTGRFRPAPLLAVGDAAPYLHDGSVASLEALFDRRRFADDYREGVRGPGPIRGHAFGTDLSAEDRAALIAYLRTL